MGAKSFRRSGACECCGRLRRALAAVCFALALPLWGCAQGLTNADTEAKGAAGARPQTAVYGFERAATELGFGGGGSLSGTAAAGTAEQAWLGLIAFRYARVVSRGENLAFKYTLDVPVAQMSFPPAQAPGSQAPPGPAQLAEQRRSITGAGLSPIGFQLNFRRRERVQPFVQASGGFLYFGERVPDSGGARLNFTTDFGGGVQWKAGTRRAWTVGYRYHHVTNDYRVGVHPGFDSNLFYAGFSIFR